MMQVESAIQANTVTDRWLFSPSIDLTVFLGSAVLSLVLLLVGAQVGERPARGGLLADEAEAGVPVVADGCVFLSVGEDD